MAKPPDKKARESAQKLICENRRARHDFSIEDRLEAGLVLVGTEVKACRSGKVHLNDAHVQIIRNEAFLMGGNIAEYSHGNRFNHEPVRSRKLLLHRHELDKLSVRLRERGFTAFPLSMYFKEGRVKVEIGVGKGKTEVDRRGDIKERDADREIQKAMRARNR